MKIYENMTSDCFFISSEKSSTGWFVYDGEFFDEWKPFFDPESCSLCVPFTNMNLKKYREIRKLVKEYK